MYILFVASLDAWRLTEAFLINIEKAENSFTNLIYFRALTSLYKISVHWSLCVTIFDKYNSLAEKSSSNTEDQVGVSNSIVYITGYTNLQIKKFVLPVTWHTLTSAPKNLRISNQTICFGDNLSPGPFTSIIYQQEKRNCC